MLTENLPCDSERSMMKNARKMDMKQRLIQLEMGVKIQHTDAMENRPRRVVTEQAVMFFLVHILMATWEVTWREARG